MKYQSNLLYLLAFVCLLPACSKSSDSHSSGAGAGGSLAKFTISAGHLYTVSLGELKSYDITNPASPIFKNKATAPDAQTIFPYKDKLFVGAASGIYIYDISTPSQPTLKGQASHLRACDPVVADGNYAYSTLQGSNKCGSAEPGLYVYDISDITKPLLKQFLHMSTPKGLGLQETTLYVCGENYGLSVFDVSNPEAPAEKSRLLDATSYQDVIIAEDLLICYVNTGLLLYDISTPLKPVLLQQINQ